MAALYGFWFRSVRSEKKLTAVGFEPTRIAPPELESGALDRSAKLSSAVILMEGIMVRMRANSYKLSSVVSINTDN